MTQRIIILALLLVPLAGVQASASFYAYDEAGGMVVGEGELFTSRITAGNGTAWTIKPTENSGTAIIDGGPIVSNARGGEYAQTLPDNQSPGGSNVPPEIRYRMMIDTVGTYRLYVRWDGNNSNRTTRGQSDSMFADVVELKDGTGGTIADWYELTESVNGNFASPAWDVGGGFETNAAGAPNNPMTWSISTPGLYTLRFTQREDGAAVDAWVFQRSNLPGPSGNGPAVSNLIIPEPSALLIWSLLAGLGVVTGLRRRKP